MNWSFDLRVKLPPVQLFFTLDGNFKLLFFIAERQVL